MVQGIYVRQQRPMSKQEVLDALASNPHDIYLEATALSSPALSKEWDGFLDQAPPGRYTFVGPNPATNRRFYGTIIVESTGRIKIT